MICLPVSGVNEEPIIAPKIAKPKLRGKLGQHIERLKINLHIKAAVIGPSIQGSGKCSI
jgi:hypothetical protein